MISSKKKPTNVKLSLNSAIQNLMNNLNIPKTVFKQESTDSLRQQSQVQEMDATQYSDELQSKYLELQNHISEELTRLEDISKQNKSLRQDLFAKLKQTDDQLKTDKKNVIELSNGIVQQISFSQQMSPSFELNCRKDLLQISGEETLLCQKVELMEDSLRTQQTQLVQLQNENKDFLQFIENWLQQGEEESRNEQENGLQIMTLQRKLEDLKVSSSNLHNNIHDLTQKMRALNSHSSATTTTVNESGSISIGQNQNYSSSQDKAQMRVLQKSIKQQNDKFQALKLLLSNLEKENLFKKDEMSQARKSNQELERTVAHAEVAKDLLIDANNEAQTHRKIKSDLQQIARYIKSHTDIQLPAFINVFARQEDTKQIETIENQALLLKMQRIFNPKLNGNMQMQSSNKSLKNSGVYIGSYDLQQQSHMAQKDELKAKESLRNLANQIKRKQKHIISLEEEARRIQASIDRAMQEIRIETEKKQDFLLKYSELNKQMLKIKVRFLGLQRNVSI